jgi:hypothetical protein
MADVPHNPNLSAYGTKVYLHDIESEYLACLNQPEGVMLQNAVALTLKVQMLVALQNSKIIELLEGR